LSELQDFAREHKIKVSGKKKELITRILSFLGGDEESTKVKKPSKKSPPKEQTATTAGAPSHNNLSVTKN
jgi:hypothetical protein